MPGSDAARPKILLVDDDPAGLQALRLLLDDPAYDRVEADSGRAALTRCLHEEFALVLLDVRMPDIDGFEVASTLRAHHRFKETPIIFLTADLHGDAQRLHGYELGAVDYLVKPVEPYALRAKVSVFVALWNRTAEVRRQGERLRELEARELHRQLEERTEAERRRADAQIRAALERESLVFRSVPIVGFTRRADTRVEWVSDSAARVLGFPAAAFAADPHLWERNVHPDDLADALAALGEIGAGAAARPITWRWTCPDGTQRWFLEQAVRPAGRDGLVGTWLDVHQQKMLEEALRKANEDLDRRVRERTAELETANREMESFSYSVAHDLRAPLRAMHGFSKILVDSLGSELPDEALDAQARLLAAVSRMERLIDDLLDLARVSRRALTRCTVDLARVAEEVVAGLRDREPGRGVVVSMPDRVDVDADPHLARIVLENLLGNAWKFSRTRDPAHVELGRAEDDPCVLFVRDDGVGFDPAYTARLFEPFERLHGTHEFEGTGIGLATVKRILERHGGWIRADGKPDGGATFWFSFGGAPLGERCEPTGRGGGQRRA